MNTEDAVKRLSDVKEFGREKGVALVSALIVVSVAAGIFAAVMYFALSGTDISGLQRKYQSSKEASLGAIDVLTKDLVPRVMGGSNLSAVVATLVKPAGVLPAVTANAANDACFSAKLTTSTSGWPGGACDSGAEATTNPDIIFNLKGKADQTKPYVVSMKIIDTVSGNSDRSGVVLDVGSGVVDDASSLIRIQHFPFLYTIVTDARQQGSTTERANMEVLYAY